MKNSRIFFEAGLLFLILTFIFIIAGPSNGVIIASYAAYVLFGIGSLLTVINWFRSKHVERLEQADNGSRLLIGFALVLLVLTMIFLIAKNNYGANFFANLSYLFLAGGVWLALIGYFLDSKKESSE